MIEWCNLQPGTGDLAIFQPPQAMSEMTGPIYQDLDSSMMIVDVHLPSLQILQCSCKLAAVWQTWCLLLS